MNIYKMEKEELEQLSYTDIAYEILKKEQKTKTTIDLFKSMGELLELSDEMIANKIGDFYTTLTTDRRFFALSTGEWDLKEKHTTKIVIEDEDDDYDIEEIVEEEEEIEEEKNIDYDSTDDYEENDLEDLVIVDENDDYDN